MLLAAGATFLGSGSVVSECSPKRTCIRKPAQHQQELSEQTSQQKRATKPAAGEQMKFLTVPPPLPRDCDVDDMRVGLSKLDIPFAHSVKHWNTELNMWKWRSFKVEDGAAMHNERRTHIKGFNESVAWLQRHPLPEDSAVGFCL